MTRHNCIKRYMKASMLIIIAILICFSIYKKTRFYYNDPFFVPFGHRLNSQNLVLKVGESYDLRLQNVNKRLNFESSDFKVAPVLFTGRVYGLRVGTAVISVSYDDKVAKCKVRVIDINHKEITVGVGKKKALRIEGTSSSVSWKSKNESVVKVSNNGEITGMNYGSAVVTGKVHDKLFKCKVTVK